MFKAYKGGKVEIMALVSNLINDRGNAVANQFVISEQNKISFQSYQSLVCVVCDNEIVFGRDWDYSRTTMKHLNTFLRDLGYHFLGSKDIRKAIECGKFGDMIVKYDSSMR